MGLTLSFYVGDANKIVSAVNEVDFEYLDSFEEGCSAAEFSLHLQPKDLGYLSMAFGNVMVTEPVLLRECLVFEPPMSDNSDRGAYKVGPTWVSFVNSLPDSKVLEVCQKWVDIMNKEYPEENIILNEDMFSAVKALVNVCRTACKESKSVVHVWFA